MRHCVQLLTLGLVMLCVASCVTLERKPVEKHFYALETVRPGLDASALASATPSASSITILVRRMQVSPRIAGRELVYRTAPSAWTSDYYNMFFVSPADMLTQDLRTWLTSARVCATVVDPGSLAPSDYILEGNVSSLHGDFAVKPSQAVAEMQFVLLKPMGSERQVVFTREYRKNVALAADSPQELVRALRQAVAGVYADLEADLLGVLPPSNP